MLISYTTFSVNELLYLIGTFQLAEREPVNEQT